MRHRQTRVGDRSTEAIERHAYSVPMRFEVLGSLRVVAAVAVGGGTAPFVQPSLGGPKQRFVLARLLAEPNRVVSLDRLIDGLWGDDPPETARHTIQGYVSELRKTVGPLIERDGVGYRIAVDRQTLDSLEFEARVEDAGCSGQLILRTPPRTSSWRSGCGAALRSTTFRSRHCRPRQPASMNCGSRHSRS